MTPLFEAGKPFDVVIIGGSFAGLAAAMPLARARRSVCVIDAGAPRNRYAAQSHGFFGQDGAAPFDLLQQARQQLAAYPGVTFLQGQASSAAAQGEGFSVTLADGQTLSASKLILAYGLTDELPEIPGLQARWGKTALHCPYCHGYEFAGQALGVLHVAPVSVHQALLISDWGPTALLLNGPAEIDDTLRSKLAQRKVQIEPTALVAIEGEPHGPLHVRLADERVLTLNALYLASHVHMNSPIAQQLGCDLDETPFGAIVRVDPTTRQTSVPGVYAAGDLARLAASITFAVADGMQAGVSAHQAMVFG